MDAVSSELIENEIELEIKIELEFNESIPNVDAMIESIRAEDTFSAQLKASTASFGIKVRANNEIIRHEGDEPGTKMILLDIWDQVDAAKDNQNEAIGQVLEENESSETPTKKIRQYKCKKCDYSTIDNYHLKRHTSSMHEKAQLQCLICEKVFSEKFEFVQHFKICYFKCTYFGCKKMFKNIDKFNAHKRNHVTLLRKLI